MRPPVVHTNATPFAPAAQIFERNGILPIEPFGKPFDPNLHNALMELDDPTKEPGTVAFVQKRGFVINERPLRVAEVGIVRRR